MSATTQKLTATQQRVRDAVLELGQELGCAPTLREIAPVANLATASAVSYVIDQLENIGVVRREPNANRAPVVIGESCPHCAGTGIS